MGDVIDFGEWGTRKEEPDMVFPCPECDNQEFILLQSGWVKCSSCRNRWVPPQGFLDAVEVLKNHTD